MKKVDVEALKAAAAQAAAEAEAEGPATARTRYTEIAHTYLRHANPKTVLALIDRLEKAEGLLGETGDSLERGEPLNPETRRGILKWRNGEGQR